MKSKGLVWVIANVLFLCLCVGSESTAMVANFSSTLHSGIAPLALAFAESGE